MQKDCGCGHSRLLPANLCCVCNESAPESLLETTIKCILNNLHTICDKKQTLYRLKKGIVLPSEICDQLLAQCQQLQKVDNKFLGIFYDRTCTRLKRVVLNHTDITDESLSILLQRHELIELDLGNCPYITDDALNLIYSYGRSLKSLALRKDCPIVSMYDHMIDLMQGLACNLTQLRRFTLHSLRITLQPEKPNIFDKLLSKLTANLTYLDLSECSGLGEMQFLDKFTNLQSLVLYNVPRLQDAFSNICKVKTLTHLDISQSLSSRHNNGVYENENKVLATIVESLPQLKSLDISGTNLAGSGVAEEGFKHCTDIPGLGTRVNRPLDFLGLYGTHHAACRRHDIPAEKVSGDATEEQILIAAAAYLDRADVLQRVLNDLYHMFRFETCQYIGHALSIILQSMDRHPRKKQIQVSSSATLFYIVKGKDRSSFGVRIKRHMISTLLNAMYYHKEDDTMMRNGCLTLCQFKIPQDVLFEYERLVQILLHSVSEMQQESFVQRIGIYLLNTLACQVGGRQKQRLGDLGVINKMLNIIEERLSRGVCDDVLEVAWSTMWNVTDETPLNCRRFLDAKGMEYFLDCLKGFPDQEELLRNMMGLLGNVAEVKSLRPRLMTYQYIQVFSNLLGSSSDGIEVSYNAAGVLAHMASDGPSVWLLSQPNRQEVLDRMTNAIERWTLTTERNINYRSFEPILNLVQAYHTPECQHWAVWALANLTTVYPVKYCSLVQQEGGISLLRELLNHEEPPERVKSLASIVIRNCTQFNKNGYVESVAPLDG
ncbi:protein zer-1 homolog [Chrysoperla carnea]|uniref:protein zer-1 homolog n=1 Tax=Chrysoperla carnea TaxID=189513 RepID=UPI001D072AC7|nr:protein zer-1 homolog [Chrysoperla carnea]